MDLKYSETLSEFNNRDVSLKPYPVCICVESVVGCPFTCVMCKTAPTECEQISKKILKMIEPYFRHIEVLSIHGHGEPLLSDLEYFVEQSLNNDFVLHMNTNGVLLTKQKADLLLKTRLSIRFSVHAGREETYRKIMGGDLCDVKERIIYLVKNSKNSGNSHDFWFSFIVMKENIEEIETFLQLAYDCGITKVRFMRLIPTIRKPIRVRNFEFSYLKQFNKGIIDEFSTRLPMYNKLAKEMNIRIERGSMPNGSENLNKIGRGLNRATYRMLDKSFFPLMPSRGDCVVPWIGPLSIAQNGDVKPGCSNHSFLGNINDRSLEEIWHSDKMKEIRKSFRMGYHPRACEYCRGFGFDRYPYNSIMRLT